MPDGRRSPSDAHRGGRRAVAALGGVRCDKHPPQRTNGSVARLLLAVVARDIVAATPPSTSRARVVIAPRRARRDAAASDAQRPYERAPDGATSRESVADD